jgi:bifunctional non-homologous end joining protein LigD
MPTELEPALTLLSTRPPEGDEWLHEIKFDGWRAMAWLREGRCRIVTRGGNDCTARFASVARAIEELPVRDAILDGELVVFDARGRPDFGALANAFEGRGPGPVVYQLFDVPWVEGHDLRRLPLTRRKHVLATVLAGAPPVLRYTDHVVGSGPAFYQHATALGLEGSVAKRADSPYVSGRSHNWLKLKRVVRERFVVVGYTDPAGARNAFGALVLAKEDPGGLVYVGRVGTGFTEKTLARVREQLREEHDSPLSQPLTRAEARGVHWVVPEWAAEVEYRDWTADGRLRATSFCRLVPRETEETPEAPPPETRRAAKRSSRLTNPDRVLWQEVGITKQELADYYGKVGARMLPHVTRRPLTLLRCPDGREGDCFYQRHVHAAMPAGTHGVVVPGFGEGKEYVWIDDAQGLEGLVQLGALEVHPWGASIDALDRPDRLIFDLDPGPGLAWERVAEAAVIVRERLRRVGLASFVKSTGGKGLHVVVPIDPVTPWADAKAFCRSIAESLALADPARFTSKVAKPQRIGRVYVDYLRNDPTSTAIAPWSTRARPGAPVSVPLRWEELLGPQPAWNLRNIDERLKGADPWATLGETRQALPETVA